MHHSLPVLQGDTGTATYQILQFQHFQMHMAVPFFAIFGFRGQSSSLVADVNLILVLSTTLLHPNRNVMIGPVGHTNGQQHRGT
jgi:hypothetical protein